MLAIAVIVLIATFNADSYKPRIIAAVEAATGRKLALNGPIGLKFSLHPTIEAKDVALANPPGFSRPDMARIQAIDIQLDLLPLLGRRLQIGRLVLIGPDILLERTAAGEVNWGFGPHPAAPAIPSGQRAPGETRRMALAVNDLRIENGTIAYREDRTGHLAAVALRTLQAQARSGAPMHLTAQAVVNGLPFAVTADTGSIDALEAPPAAKGWPVKAHLTAANATLDISGSVARPLEGHGYAVTVNGTIPDLAALKPFAPNAGLPPLHAVVLTARVEDAGGFPRISGLTLQAGEADLTTVLPGLKLAALNVAAPALDQPVHVKATGSLDNAALSLVASVGAPSRLLTGQPAGVFPIDLTAEAAGSQLTVKGGIADPVRLTGLDLALGAHIADSAVLSPLVRQKLPTLTNAAFEGRLTAPKGLAGPIALQGAKLTSAQGDVAGDVSLGLHPAAIHARLKSERLDADALQAGLRGGAAPPRPAPQPPPAGPKAAPRGGHVIPDTKLPFDRLRGVNADVEIAVIALITGGETWKDVAGHLVVQGGKLQLAPFKATLPAGPLDLSLTVDGTQPAPPVAVKLQAPAASLQQLLALAGQPGFAKGTLDVRADLNGAGDTPHAIAATLNGTLTATMTGGEIENRVLEAALGSVIARANPIALLQKGSSSEIHCFAARLTAHNGVATLIPFLLGSTLITVDGTGTLNLGTETLDLHLHPQGRIGGTGFAVPLTVTGGFADPHVAMNEAGAAQTGVEVVIGALAGRGGVKLPGVAGPSCASALAEARGETAPAAAPPAAGPAAPAKPTPKTVDPGALLRQLLR